MSTWSATDSTLREQLSALADGETDAASAAAACDAWDADSSTRSAWHTYQLIGDVLRSQDLTCDPAREIAFLGALRARLEREAPMASWRRFAAGLWSRLGAHGRDRTSSRSRSFWVPSAVGVGFVALAGVFFVPRVMEMRTPVEASLASGERSAADLMRPVGDFERGGAKGAVTAAPIDRRLIRDARLDRYLAAHKQFAGSSALGIPSSYLRNATVDSSDR